MKFLENGLIKKINRNWSQNECWKNESTVIIKNRLSNNEKDIYYKKRLEMINYILLILQ